MKKLYYLWILDKSSSMQSVCGQTIENVNGQIATVRAAAKENDIEAYATLLLFSSGPCEFVYVNQSVDQIKDITEEDYRPEGFTALRDAVGNGVARIQKELGDAIANEDVKVLVTIFTDGDTNSDVTFDHATIQRLIKQLSEDGKWTFTFLGAGGIKEVQTTATSYGVLASNVFAYQNNAIGHQIASAQMTSATSNFMRSYSAGADVSKDFFAQTDE